MYWLMAIDALVRIAFAMVVLFVVVPALAWPQRRASTFLEKFFWNLGVGITLLTLVGQLLSLANLFSFIAVLLVACLVVLLGRAAYRREPPWALVRRTFETAFLALLNIADGRVNVRRRIRRRLRRLRATLREKTASRAARLQIAGWTAVTTIAAGLRLYRPLASANLGFSDTYVHLYLVQLLADGRQVDPQFGPYPRGMHFLLLTIHHLTNVDLILLMNFFGPVVGVLMTLAVVDTARRLSGNVGAGLISGFLFATIVGGPKQSFLLGAGDWLLSGFHRQTSTLPHELALVLLFPAGMFLLDFLQRGDRWHLIGFAGCTAAIAAIHSGVLLPLLLMAILAVVAVAIQRRLAAGTIRRFVLAAIAGTVVGSAWALAFVAYPYFGGKSEATGGFSPRVIATVYTPFIDIFLPRSATPAENSENALLTLTVALGVCAVLAAGLMIASFVGREDLRVNRLWIGAVYPIFLLMHLGPLIGFPKLVDTARNSEWLMMSMVIVAAVAIDGIWSYARSSVRALTPAFGAAAALILLILWTIRVPYLGDRLIHDRIVNHSGYSGSTLAVLKIERSLEPYTWTLVSYGQEFPMVLGRGFHLPATEFLDRYDPTVDVVPIPTPHIFVIVEKTAHPFEIQNWARRFSRGDLEQRLQTWIYLYQTTHKNVRVFLEDENVRVYEIDRTTEEIERISRNQ